MQRGSWLERPASEKATLPTTSWIDRCSDLLTCKDEGSDGVWLRGSEGDASVSELSFLLLCACELASDGDHAAVWPKVADTLWSRLDVHGRIQCHRAPAKEADCYQDYYPGQVVLALAAATRRGFAAPRPDRLLACRRYYRHRFRFKRDFGQASWWAQASAAWYAITFDREWAEFAFEIGEFTGPHAVQPHGRIPLRFSRGQHDLVSRGGRRGDPDSQCQRRDADPRSIPRRVAPRGELCGRTCLSTARRLADCRTPSSRLGECGRATP